MDGQQLFWATGINNTGLQQDAQSAIAIFQNLSKKVNGYLDEITQKYQQLHQTSKVKFDNPVDPAMVSSIKSQISDLGKVIDSEIQKLGQFSATYDKSISKISGAASKIGANIPTNSPLQGIATSIKKDVDDSNSAISFLERRFKYAIGSMLAYGSVNLFKDLASDIIKVKGQFDQMQVAIDSFVGSASKGRVVMEQLTSLAVKSPFQLLDITDSAKQLLAYGDDAEHVTGTVKMLSDVSAGSAQSLKDISYLYGTSLTQGRLYARDLFQFANRGVPIYEALSKTMKDFNGNTGMSTEKIMNMVKAGKVGFPELKAAIESMTAAGGLYYGMSDKLAETTYGKISNLKDKWTLALKEMGEASGGVVNFGVSAVTEMITHWEDLAKAIAVAAEIVGSAYVAKVLVGVQANLAAKAAMAAEEAALASLVGSERIEAMTKETQTRASSQYALALRAELEAQMVKLDATIASNEAELQAATQKEITAGISMASAEKEMAAAVASGDAIAIKRAEIELESATTNKNTATKELNIIQSSIADATYKREAISKGIDSAANAADTASTNFLTAAKERLILVSKNLYTWMAANPYATAIVAVGALVTLMWALHDSTTAAERAQRGLKDSLDAVQKTIEAKQKKFDDLLNTIKSPVTSDAAKQKAFMDLKTQYGEVIGQMKLVDLQKMESTKVSKMEADSLSKLQLGMTGGVLKQKEKEFKDAKIAYEQAKRAENSVNTSQDILAAGLRTKAAKDEVDAKRQAYLGAREEYIKNIKAQDAASNASREENIVHDKVYWGQVRDQALASLGQIDDKVKAKLDKGITAGISPDTVKMYQTEEANLKKANEALSHYEETKQQKAAVSAENRLSKIKAEQDKRLELIRNGYAKLAQLQTESEVTLQAATIASMHDGYSKQEAMQANSFEKRLAEIAKQREEMIKTEQSIADAEFINANPNYVKERKKLPKITELNAQDQATINNLTLAAQKENEAAMAKLLNSQLLEYGNYTAKREEIERKYNDTISQLEQDRIKANQKTKELQAKNLADPNSGLSFEVEQSKKLEESITSSIVQGRVNQAKELMNLAFDQLKSTPEFAMAFDDLDNTSTTTLEHLMSELEKFKETAAATMNPTDMKEYVKTLNDVMDKLAERDPFGMLAKRQKELADAENALAVAKRNLDIVNSGGQVAIGITSTKTESGISGSVSTNTYDQSTDSFKKKGIDTLNATKVVVNGVSTSYLTNAQAASRFVAAQNNVQKATNNVGKALTASLKSVSEFSTALDNVGKSIGGNVGQVVSGIGQIGSLAVQGITSVKSIVDNTTKGIAGVLTTATGVLGIITAAIQAVTIVVSLFDKKSAATKAYEKLKEQSEAYSKVLDEVISKQKEMIDTLDGISAASKGDEAIANLKKQIETYRELAKAGGEAGASAGSHSYGHRTNRDVGKFYADFSKSAGQSIMDWRDLYTLTPEQLAKIKTDNAYAWSLISSEIRDNLDKIITLGDSITDMAKEANSALAGISFDSVKDGLDDLLKSTDTTMADVADNFEGYMRTAILQIVKDNTLTASLTKWYSDFISAMNSDGGLSKSESEALKQEYEAAYQQAQSVYDAALNAAGIDKSTESSTSSSTRSAIKSMTEDQADILTAQFSALRIHGANIDANVLKLVTNNGDLLLSLQTQANNLQLMAKDITEIAVNTRDLADIKSAIVNMNVNGVKMK